ncbi:MAG: hypothetical protein LKF61_01535 [Eggerthellaceae bacterium]|nr:hypothetical protein [Eggerthellaceae bacterium]MCH4220743.1 hypothetical protein [Eggerthellaceae bacterium]
MNHQSEALERFFGVDPYGVPHAEKVQMMRARLSEALVDQQRRCPAYASLLNVFAQAAIPGEYDTNPRPDDADLRIDNFPFVPVRLFKSHRLCSVSDKAVKKVLTSSGTSGQQRSKIYLDAQTMQNQKRALQRILHSFIGPHRLPLMIFDSPLTLKDRSAFGARGAGILGFSVYGCDIHYALDKSMHLNRASIDDFLDKYAGQPILIFGYTYMIWRYIVQASMDAHLRWNFGPQAQLFHVGGWKKLQAESVSSDSFCKGLYQTMGIASVRNYYGMAEQLGSIYVECECHHLHASVFSDVIIRDPFDFSVLKHGQEGLVEVISVLPHSYPGHCLLTEDRGIVLGEDDCPCGRKGVYFSLCGRIAQAELRGCSDTYGK